MSKQILIIDDDAAVREAFELALEETGYEVSSAAGGAAGIDQVKQRVPDLIFLDLKMPGMDGVETLRRIRQGMAPDIPIYIVTAFMPEFLQELAAAAKEGLQFGLGQKPLSGEQIRLIVQGVLEQAQSY